MPSFGSNKAQIYANSLQSPPLGRLVFLCRRDRVGRQGGVQALCFVACCVSCVRNECFLGAPCDSERRLAAGLGSLLLVSCLWALTLFCPGR